MKAAVVYGRSLSGNAYKVLVAMSLQALDKPKDGRPAGLYFGGWAALQNALGYEEGGPDTKGHTAVKRAVRELRDRGHVTPMVTAAKGNRQSYLVHPGGLKGVSTDPQSPKERGSEQTLNGGLSRPQKGVSTDPLRGSEQTLLGRTEEGRGLTQDISLAQEPQPQTAQPGAESGHKFQGRPGDDCDECGRAYGNRTAHPLYLLRGGTA